MQFAHVIKLVLVVDLICAGVAVTGSVVGAILGFMVSGVLCLCVDAVYHGGTERAIVLEDQF